MNFMQPKNSNIKRIVPTVRTVRVQDKKKPAPLPSAVATKQRPTSTKPHSTRASPSTARNTPSTPLRSDSPAVKNGNGNKRKAETYMAVQSDSDDNEDFTGSEGRATPGATESRQKKQKVGARREVDTTRKLKSKKAFAGKDAGGAFIHAADILSSARVSKRAGGVIRDDTIVTLQYPSDSARERYVLRFIKDEINPAEEILKVAQLVTQVYLTPEQAEPFNPETGILRKLERTKNLLLKNSKTEKDKAMQEDFKAAVEVYNSKIRALVKDGGLAKNLDMIHHLPGEMVQRILGQVYDRAVAPDVDSLKEYENGSDNVYGELLYPFVSRVLSEANLKSDKVFVDLGSGVGNVVLQAALEFGCESWGCEMMMNSCNLADRQLKEFAARCRLWGIQSGEVRLERGDFRQNQAILDVLPRADVILVNNEVFSPELNRNLIDLFLECKDGCKIISLKSFVPSGHQISEKNSEDPVNLLDVQSGYYFQGDVSWTDAGGRYYVATKTHRLVKEYEKRFGKSC